MPDRAGLPLLIQREFQTPQDGVADAFVICALPVRRTVHKGWQIARSFIRLYACPNLLPENLGRFSTDFRWFKCMIGVVEHRLVSISPD